MSEKTVEELEEEIKRLRGLLILRHDETAHALSVAENALFELGKGGNMAAKLALQEVQPIACLYNAEVMEKRVSILDTITNKRDDGGISFSTRIHGPNWFVRHIAESVSETFDENKGVNYVEVQVVDDKKKRNFIVTVQLETGMTPHQAREKAEEKVKKCTAFIRKLDNNIQFNIGANEFLAEIEG